MHDIQVEVRQARHSDIERILHLQHHARRSCVRYGHEDLVRMIDRDYCYIADTGPLLWGFLCATAQQPSLAQIRGLALVNGWRVDTGISYLLEALEVELQADEVRYLMHMAVESWTTPPMIRQDFSTLDYIVNYERAAPRRPLLPEHANPLVELRSLGPNEIGELTALDHRAFSWPWQLSSGDLVRLLMTTSRLVVLDYQGVLAGYACTDVNDGHAQIIRIAVDPVYHNMGFGRFLLADALDFAAGQRSEVVALNTQWQNRSSQRLYQGFGFRVVGRRIPVMIKQIT